MNIRSKKASKPNPNQITLNHLSDDVLCYLFVLSGIKNVLLWRSVSKRLENLITNMMETLPFWQAITRSLLSNEQYESIQTNQIMDFKKIVENRYTPIKTLRSDLDNHSYFKVQGGFHLFNQKEYIYNARNKIQFKLDEIKPHLMMDDAYHLFSKVSRLEEIYPVIQDDNFDQTGLNKIVNHLNSRLNNDLMIGDMCFIGILPSIMNFRALNCFDVFIKAYFALKNNFPNIKGVENYKIDKINNMVFDTKDTYFIQRYLLLMLKFHAVEEEIYKVIKITLNEYKKDWVCFAISALPSGRKNELFTTWRKLPDYCHLLDDLYPEEKTRHKLMEVMAVTKKLLYTNDLDIQTLTKLRNETISYFNTLIQALPKDNNENNNSIISTNSTSMFRK